MLTIGFAEAGCSRFHMVAVDRAGSRLQPEDRIADRRVARRTGVLLEAHILGLVAGMASGLGEEDIDLVEDIDFGRGSLGWDSLDRTVAGIDCMGQT